MSVVRMILSSVNGPPRYWRSTSKRATARGSGVAGTGNQNMLEVTATTVSTMPQTFFLYAKEQNGRINSGRTYQLSGFR
jgi:hypothetical protein